jgi:phospho-N-acetylmuramoyl-pentapeptide-transferase
MLYALFGPEGALGAGIELIRAISVRAACAALTAFLLCWWLGPRVIERLKRLHIGERTDKTDSATLAEMHRKKIGTPTMGGIFLVGSIFVSFSLWTRFDTRYSGIALAVITAYGIVGLLDDWIKLRDPARKGLSARWKFWAMAAVGFAVGIALYLVFAQQQQSRPGQLELRFLPFSRDLSFSLAWPLGIPFILVTTMVLCGSGNAVNLTDGMDGLASGCVALAALAFAGITYAVGHREHAEYLRLVFVPGAGEMTVLCAALVGAALGFLWFNAAPAMVFMGDVGSLPLGGILGYVAMVARVELVLAVVGGVFVVEALSVILQVAWFKRTGRRILRCAPLHHHFQFAGVPETRIVVRFWIVAGLLALTSLGLLRVA